MAAERQLDLRGLELLLDGVLGFGVVASVGLGRRLVAIRGRLPLRQLIAYDIHDAA